MMLVGLCCSCGDSGSMTGETNSQACAEIATTFAFPSGTIPMPDDLPKLLTLMERTAADLPSGHQRTELNSVVGAIRRLHIPPTIEAWDDLENYLSDAIGPSWDNWVGDLQDWRVANCFKASGS